MGLGYVVIAGYAFFGRAQAIQALAMSWLFSMVSPGIAPDTTTASLGRYLVLAAAAASVCLRSEFMRHDTRISAPVLGTLLLGCLIVLHSLFVSPMRDVSVLKAISWTIAAATILSAWTGVSPSERERLTRHIFGGLAFLLVVSLPLLGSGLGYLRNDSGFQGVLAHPQAFGPTMALLGTWCGAQLLSSKTPSWGAAILFGATLVLVVLSEARTAGVSMLLGLSLASLLVPLLARRSIRSLLPGLRSPRFHMILALSFFGVLVAGSVLSGRIGQYLYKKSESTSVAGAYDASRGSLIAQMYSNISEQPWSGIGFGIASYPEDMIVERDPMLGLPTGAAIEKGVLPVAVLEEIGVLGLIAVIGWLWMLVVRAARGGGITALGVFFVVLLMNMGESVLFSPGGMGLLSLILIGWAVTERQKNVGDFGHA